jgi:hypothetical protein
MDFVTCSEDFIACRSVVIWSCIISTTLEHILGFRTPCSKTAHRIATNTEWTYLGAFHLQGQANQEETLLSLSSLNIIFYLCNSVLLYFSIHYVFS